jgi:membrane fusion protein (multidrug efflux system)
MRIAKKYLVLILSAFVIIIGSMACSDTEGANTETAKNEIRKVSVEVTQVNFESYTDYIPVMGTVQAVQKTSLSAYEGARVKKILVDKGSKVTKGDTILVLENDILRANLDAAEAQYRIDQINYEKQEQIFKDKVNSEFQVLQAKYKRDASKANYELVKARYDKTFLIAPFSGIVDRRNFDLDEFAAPGLPIIEMMNNTKFKVEVGVPERYVGQIKKGVKVKIKLKNVESELFVGTVSYVGASIITDNRTFPVEIMVEGNSPYLKPELAAEVYIENGIFDNVVKIPDEVLSRIDDGYIVFVVENEIAKSRKIEILNRAGEEIAVKKGLSAGDKLVTVGYQNLIDGQSVKIVN